MKICTVHQPAALGDILFVQRIMQHIIKDGWTVYYPVEDFYYDVVNSYVHTDGLTWCKESDDFPLKEFYGREEGVKFGNMWYLPLTWADCYARTQPMISKYFYANVPVDDWRDGLNIKRNLDKEKLLIDTYDLTGDYILVNRFYNHPTLEKSIKNPEITTKAKIHYTNFFQDRDNGFNIFDWIGAIEGAKEIHTVGTSFAYLVDKYSTNSKIYCYERRLPGQDRTYHEEIHLVHRNPNWIYMD